MKFKCRWCGEEIEITQSEKAKTGMKKFDDHEIKCFKSRNPNFRKIVEATTSTMEVPEKFDMQGIIRYLHQSFGRLPTKNEALRFHIFLVSFDPYKATKKECAEFVELLKDGFSG